MSQFGHRNTRTQLHALIECVREVVLPEKSERLARASEKSDPLKLKPFVSGSSMAIHRSPGEELSKRVMFSLRRARCSAYCLKHVLSVAR